MADNTSNVTGRGMPDIEELDCDRAAWLLDRLEKLAEVAVTVHTTRQVGADEETIRSAIRGAIRGTAREVCRLMGFKPGVNLEKVR